MTRPSPPPPKGTLRLLVFAVVDSFGQKSLDAVYILGAGGGAPNGAHFTLGDEIVCGESSECGDGAESPAEFHYEQEVSTGLWIIEWDWTLTEPDPDDDELETAYREALYGHDRWSRPTLADLIAFGVMEPVDA